VNQDQEVLDDGPALVLPEGPFALIRRGDEDTVELLRGRRFEEHSLLADLPIEGGGDSGDGGDLLKGSAASRVGVASSLFANRPPGSEAPKP